MPTLSLAYTGPTTITMDLSALAASTTYVAGRECSQIDNTTDVFIDAMVFGRFTVGTTPTLPCTLNVYVWGADVSLVTTAIDVLDGVDSAETLTNSTILTNAFGIGASCPVLVATSDLTYDIKPFSVARALQLDALPRFWGLYVAHNMTAALRTIAGNTNAFRFFGIKYLSA